MIAYLLQNQAVIDDLLIEIDKFATSRNSYEYGLPLYEPDSAAMREIVYRWIAKIDQVTPVLAYSSESPKPETCPDCEGAGQYLGHSADCDSDQCALNGDLYSCDGEMQFCQCEEGQALAKMVVRKP